MLSTASEFCVTARAACTTPDQVILSGVLQCSAAASVHLKGGTASGTRFLFEIHGTEGALAIVPADPRAC
jgi:Gal80-like protein